MAASFMPVQPCNQTDAQGFWRDTFGQDVLRMADVPISIPERCSPSAATTWELSDMAHSCLLALVRTTGRAGMDLRGPDPGPCTFDVVPVPGEGGGWVFSEPVHDVPGLSLDAS